MLLLSSSFIIFFFLFFWKVETKFRIVLTPFILFSAYFILRVVPGFYLGIAQNEKLEPIFYFVAPIAYFCFAVGYFVVSKGEMLNEYNKLRDFTFSHNDRDLAVVLFIMVIFIIFGLLMYQGIPPSINAAYSVANNSIDASEAGRLVSEARREISKGHVFNKDSSSNGVFREFIFIFGCVFLTSTTAFFLKKNKFSNIFLIISLALCYVFVSGDGTRGRFVVVLTSAAIAYSVYKPISLKYTFRIFILLVFISIFLGLYTNKMSALLEVGDWEGIFLAIFERIFIGNSINDSVAIDAFHSGYLDRPYGYWLFRDLLAFIPGVSSDKPLAYYLYLYEIGGNSTTYLTGTSLSRAYADGGGVGVVLYFGILGMICGAAKFLIGLLLKIPSPPILTFSFLITLLVGFGQAYVSGLATIIFITSLGLFFFFILRALFNVKIK